MEKFIQSGKGFCGIHSAADTEYSWTWYRQLVRRMFYIHPPQQTALLKIADYNFPCMSRLPEPFSGQMSGMNLWKKKRTI